MKKKFTPIRFPRDGGAHPAIIEWWYFNGRLSGADGGDYAFMNCLFKTDPKRVKIPFLTKLPVKTLYFYHSLLTDIRHRKFYPRLEPAVIVSSDSFSKTLLSINHNSPLSLVNSGGQLEETAPFHYRLRDQSIDLELVAAKPPLLEGGRGFVELGKKSTYYYSLTDLKARGRMKVGKRWLEVAGQAWMDHQWADVAYSKDQWSWFSLQLDNDCEIIACEYISEYDTPNEKRLTMADIMTEKGRQIAAQAATIRPQGRAWISPKTRAAYPTSWLIEIPEKKIKLSVNAPVTNQEMLYGTINYWEGPINISGHWNGRVVRGHGFMELAGYPADFAGVRLLESELQGALTKLFLAKK